MAKKISEKNCYTFLWKLENISFCLQKKEECIDSPTFVVDAIDQTKWKLWLYPRGEIDGNHLGYFLHREADSKGADEIEINYELAFIAKDRSVLHFWKTDKAAFPKGGGGRGQIRFIKREDVFISRRSTFLPEDSLTARCRIWQSDGEMAENILCTAHTRIGVQRKSFLWKLDFSKIESEKKYNYQIESLNNDSPIMSVDLSVTGGLSSGEIIRFELFLQDETIKLVTLQLSLIDASGSRVECNNDEFWFDSPVKYKEFTFSLTKKKLMAMKSVYLPDDVLSLHWEWVFSKGVVSEEIEENQYGCSSFENKISDNQSINNEKVSFSDTFKDNLKSLCDKQFLCDINLKTKTRTFSAHKLILSAASSVFSAMFSNEMKEKDSDDVNIEDLNEDTVSGMLLFIYTGCVENLSWESASHLYVAADKYDIPSLKNVCSSYLKDNLSSNNVCEVLLLSDFHADGDLKSAVQDYFLKHIKDIVNSEEWKFLLETNAKLAAETVCLQYK